MKNCHSIPFCISPKPSPFSLEEKRTRTVYYTFYAVVIISKVRGTLKIFCPVNENEVKHE